MEDTACHRGFIIADALPLKCLWECSKLQIPQPHQEQNAVEPTQEKHSKHFLHLHYSHFSHMDARKRVKRMGQEFEVHCYTVQDSDIYSTDYSASHIQ